MAKHEIKLLLNADRREQLYNQIHRALTDHHNGKPNTETPALLYEALDALALSLASIFVGVERGVGEQAAKTAKRFFRDQADHYGSHLRKQPKNSITVQ